MSKQLLKAISDLSSCNHCTVVIGDFNLADIACEQPISTSSSPVSRRFLEMFSSQTLVQLVKCKTLGNNILDPILCNGNELVGSVEVRESIGSSDHATVHFTINLSVNSERFCIRRDYKKADSNKIVS